MALRDRWYTIRFTHGKDGEGNEKTLLEGHLAEAENVTFTERTTATKRNGTRFLGRRLLTSEGYASVSGALGLSSRSDDDDLVMLTGDDRVCSYDPTTDAWVYRGDWTALSLDYDGPVRGPHEGWDTTAASLGNVQVIAWEDLRGGVWGLLRDIDTGVSFGREFRIGGHFGRSPRALAVGSQLHVYFVSGSANSLNVGVMNPVNPTARTANIVIVHPAIDPNNPTYDVDTIRGWNNSRVAVSISGSTFISVVREDGTIGSSGSIPSWPNPRFYDPSTCNPAIALSPDGSKMAVAVRGPAVSGSSIYARVYDSTTFAVITGSVPLDSSGIVTSSVGNVINIGVGYWNPSSGGERLGVWSSISGSTITDRHVRLGSVEVSSLPYTSASAGTLIRHSTLSTRPFSVGGHGYVWVNHPSTYQSTDFLVREDSSIDATSRYGLCQRIISGVLGGVEVRSDMDQVHARSGATSRDAFIAVSGGLSAYGDRHPVVVDIAYHPSASWRPADVDGILYMPGGFLGKYDGSNVTENNFLLRVEGISASLGSGTLPAGRGIMGPVGSMTGPLLDVGPLATASFVYEVIPVAYDAMGNEEQGSCITPIQVFPTASLTEIQNSASLSWPTIAHTRRDGVRAPDIRFKVFRTGYVNGVPLTTRQRIDDPAYPIVNSTASDWITFNDTVPQSVQSLGETSYTQISPEQVPTPAFSTLTNAGDRIYLSRIEGRPLEVIPSKLRLGGPVGFAEDSGLLVDSLGGPITGLGAIDGEVAIFKDSRVYHMPAAGPDNTLIDTTPNPIPELVTSDVGAPYPSTVVQVAGTTVQGLIFRSARGTRALVRGMSVVDVGSRVRDLDSLNVVSGLSPSQTEEMRMYTSEGTTMVLNTRYNEWSTFRDQSCVAAATYRGAAAFVDDDGRVRLEGSGSWLDGATPYNMRLTTGWLPLSDLQGMSRVRRIFILGDFYSHHVLRIEMATDWRDSWRTVAEIDTRTALGVTFYGGPTTGSITPGAAAHVTLTPLTNGTGPTLRYSHTGTVGNSHIIGIANVVPFGEPLGLFEGPGVVPGYPSATGSLIVFPEGARYSEIDTLISEESSYLTVATGSIGNSTLEPADDGLSWTLSGGTDSSGEIVSGAYGEGPYGGRDSVYQFERNLPVQRMQSLKLRFTDVSQDTTGSLSPGRSFSLTEVRLLVASDGKPELPGRKRSR